MIRHASPISGIASFSDQYVATAGYDNRVILWDAQTKLPIGVGVHDHLANQCEFSRCGNFLVTASSDYTARLWQVPQMKLLTVFSHHEDDIEMITVHPSKQLIATASRDHRVRVFNFAGQLLQTLTGHQEDVISVQWLHDSNNLISSSDDGTIRVWDIETGQQIDQLSDSGIQTDALAISPEGTVFAGDDDGQIHIMTKQNSASITAHQAGIKKLVYSASTKKLVSVAYDRKACVWNFIDGQLVLDVEFKLPNIIWPRSCAFRGDNEIVFATFGDSYAVYNYRTHVWEMDHIADTGGVNAVLAIDDQVWTVGDAGIVKKNNQRIQKVTSLCNFLVKLGPYVLTGGQSGEIFNAETGEVIYQHRSPLNCGAAYHLNGADYVVIGTYTGEGLVFKLAKNQITFDRVITLHANAIKGVAISNNILFSVCATGAAAWHQLSDDKELHFNRHAHQKIANGCVGMSDGHFASVSRDLYLRVWTSDTGELVEEVKSPHVNSIKCIAADSSNRFIATGSYKGIVAIYDRQNKTWQKHLLTNAGISALCYDIESKQFLASSYDGKVYAIN